MTRQQIIETIGSQYITSNIESGEYSYIKAVGREEKLRELMGKNEDQKIKHFKLDIRFSSGNKITPTIILVETKEDFEKDKKKAIQQLKTYLDEEKAVNPGGNIIAIYACSKQDDNRIMAWKGYINDEYLLESETVIDTMAHYQNLFETKIENNQEEVLTNTYKLNELLQEFGIREAIRSQLVGTCLLFIKYQLATKLGDGITFDNIDKALWQKLDKSQVTKGIETALEELLANNKDSLRKQEKSVFI